MKKTIAAVALGLLIAANCFADYRSGYDAPQAKYTKTNTSSFNGSLSSADTDVQKALDTLDDSVGGGGGDAFHVDFNAEVFADDQIFIADSVSAGTARTLPDCDDTAGQHLNYDNATNTPTCGTSNSSGFTDGGASITLQTAADTVGIGGAALGKFSVTGTADVVQLTVRGNATQTNPLLLAENQAGTDMLTLSNTGTLTLGGTGTATIGLGTITFTDDTDGALTITANGDGSDEALTINLDDTSNTGVVSSSTGVTSLSLTSIGITTGAASNLSAGTTTLGVVAGAVDAGGATSVEIPNGASPTVDAAGEAAVDTTDDQLVYYGAAKRVVPYTGEKCFSIIGPDGTTHDNVPIWSPVDAITVTGVYCRTQGGTSVGITISDGTNALEEVVCDSDGQADDGSITNGTFTANERMEFDTGTETGTVDSCNVCVRYTTDAQ